MVRLAKYTESILANTTGTTVVPAYGATVTVYYPDTTTPITSIYSDSAGTVAISGAQITLGVDGLLEFYVRSQDRTFDLYIEESADTSKPQFTAFIRGRRVGDLR